MTHATNITPVTMLTDSPSRSNQPRCVTSASHVPNAASFVSSPTTITAPTAGPRRVPSPPSNVMRMTVPDIVQCTSESVAKPSTSVFIAPARPAQAAEMTNANSLNRSTS
ncbi:hypothetical protein AWB67_07060 [Caballeronia terrestris]|uniref:Uncharacterized protein n=1 Tax=Caballeronia terrestris TaxID=1226301 RepID=A0A158KY50_9BURK|nr:hypothetical protein AWB67_07060 [Caballeronia terrestris]